MARSGGNGNDDRLRFESFSACCGVYARLDLLEEGVDGGDIGRGTTNVDVNDPLRRAMTRIRARDPLHLRVGSEGLTATTLDGQVVEKKVPLPGRWLRGFAETQVIASGFGLRAELPRVEAQRFLRTVLRSVRGRVWAVPVRGSLRLTTRPVPGAVCLAGAERLGAMQRVLPHLTGLRLYGPSVTADSAGTAAAWEAVLPGMRLTLTLSPDGYRGFSGEGAVLDALAGDETAQDADLLAVLLAWEARIDPVALADSAGLTAARTRAALTRLGTVGRIGYDTAEAAYFHRELPYHAEQTERDNPRLRDARALIEAGAVTLDRQAGTATVVSGDMTHRVGHADGRLSCTCLWWARHQGARGPCKHALAMRIALRRETAPPDPTRRKRVPTCRKAEHERLPGRA